MIKCDSCPISLRRCADCAAGTLKPMVFTMMTPPQPTRRTRPRRTRQRPALHDGRHEKRFVFKAKLFGARGLVSRQTPPRSRFTRAIKGTCMHGAHARTRHFFIPTKDQTHGQGGKQRLHSVFIFGGACADAVPVGRKTRRACDWSWDIIEVAPS